MANGCLDPSWEGPGTQSISPKNRAERLGSAVAPEPALAVFDEQPHQVTDRLDLGNLVGTQPQCVVLFETLE